MKISISALNKKIGSEGKTFQLGPIDFTANGSDVVGVFGRNGAGKSTFFNILSGRKEGTSGQCLLDEKLIRPDRPDVRTLIGYLEQEAELPQWLEALDVLRILCLFYKIENAEEKIQAQISFWGIDLFKNKIIRDCSYGMQKRVRLALVSLIQPMVYILDEPINGLDLEYVKKFSQSLNQWREQQKIVFLSLHSAHFAAIHCTRVLFFENGTPQEILEWSTQNVSERIVCLESRF